MSDGTAALEWYGRAFGAEEQFRVVGDDGRLGHAEFTIGTARFMLSDEYPEIGVASPTTLGGAGAALHLSVSDVDTLFARAVDAGATTLSAPADQPHGARHGTLLDPFGHRWMLSQQLEEFDVDTYRDRSEGSGFEVVGAGPDEAITVADRPGTGGGIWAGAFYEDALAGIRFLVDVLGFEEQLVVTGPDERTVVHSQLRWPEGGVVQAGTYDPANEFSRPPGSQALYVVTADPHAVWERCRAAGSDRRARAGGARLRPRRHGLRHPGPRAEHLVVRLLRPRRGLTRSRGPDSTLAPSTGFEPVAYCSGGSRSIP